MPKAPAPSDNYREFPDDLARRVRAGFINARNESITSDGTETDVELTVDPVFGESRDEVVITRDLGGGGEWVDVRSMVRLTVNVVAGSSGCDFTVVGRVDENASNTDIKASTTVSGSTESTLLEAENIEAYAWVKVTENGTDTETQKVRVLCK